MRVEDTVFDMFLKTGKINYYLLYTELKDGGELLKHEKHFGYCNKDERL